MKARAKIIMSGAAILCAAVGAIIWFAGQSSTGQGVSGSRIEDLAKQVKPLRKAADRGDAAAQTKLGILYADGIGVDKDPKKSAELYQQAANQGFAAAQFHLAGLYEEGAGVSKDLNKAIDLYQQAANGGYAPAQFCLGLLYENGQGVPQNPDKAAEFYQKAANQNYAAAQFFLGSLYEKGMGVPKNIDKAVELYQQASDHGDDSATVHLGSMYENGIGVSKDLKKAAEAYRKAADQGSELAAQNLKRLLTTRPEPDDFQKKYEEALSYTSGMNQVQIDSGEVVKRLKQLANEQCPEALARLALFAQLGNWSRWVPKDATSAQELANLALAEGLAERADHGRPNAQYLLGFFYQGGLGVAKDSEKAWQLYFAAAEGGCSDAQWYLGTRYYDPTDGSGKDPTRAVYWYEKSADQGDAFSQFALGLMYNKGVGVPQDTKKGTQLIRQAANQGLTPAQTELEKTNANPATAATKRSAAATRHRAQFAGTWEGVTQTFPWGNISQTIIIDSSETEVTMYSHNGPGRKAVTVSAVRAGDSLSADFGSRGTYTFTASADGSTMLVRLQALLNDNTATYHRTAAVQKSR